MTQSAAAGPGPPDETAAQQKLEATAENNDTSNHSSGYMTCIQRNRECIEKGSDTQVNIQLTPPFAFRDSIALLDFKISRTRLLCRAHAQNRTWGLKKQISNLSIASHT